MSPYIPRYAGPRWSIQYGAYEGIEQFALDELYRAVQRFLPYVVQVMPANPLAPQETRENVILLGTPQNNPRILELVRSQAIHLPDHPEGFALSARPAPWDPERCLVVIAGSTPAGVLNGVETFNAQVLAGPALPEKLSPEALRQCLDQLADFSIEDYPRMAERGIWTWGYVIYDYRRFLDHMARLRFNTLTIWSDTPPLNAPEVITYAHSRGIRIILGFPWGWGKDYDLAAPADRQLIEDEVLQHYRDKILPLHPDGIYFQTLTEHTTTEMAGHSVAAITCAMVNQVAAKLFEMTPDLYIQFGLHATSIQERFGDLKDLDPRITIVWEDAGALPYPYLPQLEDRGRNFPETLEYSRSLARLRPGRPFGLVPKGWTSLDWANEFEHHGEYLLGARAPGFIRQRAENLRPRWQTINTLWLTHYPYAMQFYQAMHEITQGQMTVQALIEDGLLEENIQPAVALYAQTLWNPFETPETLLSRAHSLYYQGLF